MPSPKTCSCLHAFTLHSNKTGAVGCTVDSCGCVLNRAGQGTSTRKCYVRDAATVMYVDPLIEYGPWNTKDGLL